MRARASIRASASRSAASAAATSSIAARRRSNGSSLLGIASGTCRAPGARRTTRGLTGCAPGLARRGLTLVAVAVSAIEQALESLDSRLELLAVTVLLELGAELDFLLARLHGQARV